MNTQLLSVYSASTTHPTLPKIGFKSNWLSDMGFTAGVLVQALPVPNGMDFTLCDENIPRYSDLSNETKKRGGKLLQFINNTESRLKTPKYPNLVTSGQYIYGGGLSIGDNLIAQYSYGIIKARKICIQGDTKILPMGSVKEEFTDQRIPKVRLCGYWLADYGFPLGALATVSVVPDSMTFQLQDMPYTELVPYARRNRMKVVKVHTESNHLKDPLPYIGITGSFVTTAGFGLGDMLIAGCAPGLIQVRKVDMEALGLQSQEPLS